MIDIIDNALSIKQAQRDQDQMGGFHFGERRFYALTSHSWWMRLWLWIVLPKDLFEQIEWTKEGAVFLARK